VSRRLPRWPGIEHMPRLYELGVSRSERGVAKLRRKLLAGLGGDILEIGAGTGLNLPYYAADARVTMSDLDPATVSYAAAKPVAARARLLAADASSCARCPPRSRRWASCAGCCARAGGCT
jgi:hypothetical protein